MNRLMIAIAAGLSIGILDAKASEPPAAVIPAAVIMDPPQDKAHPAGAIPFALPTHGVAINAILYTAAGAGPHPTVILFHGTPGNDANIDIARAIQRAGWDVLTLHYRGSWGSPGTYSFTHCREDGEAALAWLRAPSIAARYGVNTHRIVVVGHSMGGFVAGWLAGHDDGLAGAVLISPGRSFGNLPLGISRAAVAQYIESNLENDQGMQTVGNTTANELADEVIRNRASWDLAQYAPTLAKHPLLVVTSDDGNARGNERIAAAVNGQPGGPQP